MHPDSVQRLASTHATTRYGRVAVEGIEIFYREAGPKGAPTLLLLHGFPSSSRMWDTLIPLLADRYHLVAPDYPGFGHSAAPPAGTFPYTFDRIAEVIDGLTRVLQLNRYCLVVQDYGGPVGFRLALAHPERIEAIIVHNAAAHEVALGPLWETRRVYWADRAANEERLQANFTSFEATRLRHVGRSPHPERYNPDTWSDEFAFLNRPGSLDIQSDLFFDYQTNLRAYPAWQAYLRTHQPPLLVLWGRYDPSFEVAGAHAYAGDHPAAEIHVLDAGHFPLDEAPDMVASLMRDFVARLHR